MFVAAALLLASLPSAGLSPGDAISAASLLLLGLGQLVTWALILRDDRRGAVKTSADRAAADATESAAMRELATANERIAAALEHLEEWGRAHDLADERRFTSLEEFRKSQDETNQRLTNIAADLAARLTNVALYRAPEATARELPATRGAGR
jgi:hypothetical protein